MKDTSPHKTPSPEGSSEKTNERPPFEVLADDIPREGIDGVVRNVLAYLDDNAAELPRTLVDIISSRGYASYSYWPTELIELFTAKALDAVRDERLIRDTVVFHVTTRQVASTIPIARTVLHITALRVWAEALSEHMDGREVVAG